MERFKRKTSIDFSSSDYTSSEKEESKEVYKQESKGLQYLTPNFSFNELAQSSQLFKKVSISNEDIRLQHKTISVQGNENCNIFQFRSQLIISSSKDDIFNSNNFDQTEEKEEDEEEERKINYSNTFLSENYISCSFKIPKKNDQKVVAEVFLSDSYGSGQESSDKHKELQYPLEDQVGWKVEDLKQTSTLQLRNIDSLQSLEPIKEINIENINNLIKEETHDNQLNKSENTNEIGKAETINNVMKKYEIDSTLSNLEKIKNSFDNQEAEELNSNVSYYSFNPAISEWKEKNWKYKEDSFKEEKSSLLLENSTKYKKRIFNQPQNWLKSAISFCKNKFLNKKGYMTENEDDSDESYFSFSNRNLGRKQKKEEEKNDQSYNQFENEQDDSYFYEDLERLDILQDIQIENLQLKKERNEIFEQQFQYLESERVIKLQDSSNKPIFNNNQFHHHGQSRLQSLQLKNESDGQYFKQEIQAFNQNISSQDNINPLKPCQINKLKQPQQITKETLKFQLFFTSISYESISFNNLQDQIMMKIQKIANFKDLPIGEIIREWKQQNYLDIFLDNMSSSKLIPKKKINESPSLLNKLIQSFQKNQTITNQVCQICLNNFSNVEEMNEKHSLKCNHAFCKNCFKAHISSFFSLGKQWHEMTCPQEGCQIVPNMSDLKLFLTDYQMNIVIKQIINQYILHNKIYSICPQANCQNIQKLLSNRNSEESEYISAQRNVYCPDCKYNYCNICKEASHFPLSCTQAEKLQSLQFSDQTWIFINTQKCPKCYTNIQKNQGCLHITCTQCRYDFCWGCLKPYFQSHHLSCENKDNHNWQKKANQLGAKDSIDKENDQYYAAMHQKYFDSAKQTNNQLSSYNRQLENQQQCILSLSEESFNNFLKLQQGLEIVIQAKQFNSKLYQLRYLRNDEKIQQDVKKSQLQLEQSISRIEDILENNKIITQNILQLEERYSNSLSLIFHIIDQLTLHFKELITRVSYFNMPFITHPLLFNLPTSKLDQQANNKFF